MEENIHDTWSIDDIVRHAAKCRRDQPSAAIMESVGSYRLQFDRQSHAASGAGVTIFTFHATVPETHAEIDYIDVKHNHHQFDYEGLSDHLIWSSTSFAKADLYFITSVDSEKVFDQGNIKTIHLHVDRAKPMLERVKAMLGYVESDAFANDTVFLDTDAFPNRRLEQVFDDSFDIGVTYRLTPGYMPLNEGVIFCSARDKAAVRRFFRSYLATYEALMSDPVIAAYYGDVTRWRGGQLSLNAVAPPVDRHADGVVALDGVAFRFLPCDLFNYWVEAPPRPDGTELDDKFILHLKGDSKPMLSHVAIYQADRLKRLTLQPLA